MGAWQLVVMLAGMIFFVCQVEVSAEDSRVFMFRWVARDGRNTSNVKLAVDTVGRSFQHHRPGWRAFYGRLNLRMKPV